MYSKVISGKCIHASIIAPGSSSRISNTQLDIMVVKKFYHVVNTGHARALNDLYVHKQTTLN